MNRVIILYDNQMEFGILADVVNGTQVIEPEDILTVPATVTGIGEEYLKGVTKDRLIVLNAERLLSDKSIVANEEAN